MALDLLTWACLMLAAGSPPGTDETFHTNMRGFTIPFNIEAARQSGVSQLILYMSRDQGHSWEMYGRTTPDKKGFPFLSNVDGLFYFSIQVVDKRGHADPEDIYKSKIGQKIQIDTVKPVVKLTTAERTGDEVLVAWEIQEEHPDWPTWRLEYRVGDSPNGQWTPLMMSSPSERGNKRFRPGVPGPVTVRLSMRDQATNEGSDEKVVSGSTIDPSLRTAGAAMPIGSGGSEPPPPPPPPPPDGRPLPPVGAGSGSGSPPPPVGGGEGTPTTTLAHSTPGGSGGASGSPAPSSETAGSPTRGSLPALQIVNKREVKLGFNVGRFGPSGLGKVDVYVTTDEGATWQKSSEDPRVSFPVSPDRSGPVKGFVYVSVPKEGMVYGFYLVVKSRAGLGKPAPHPGDPPHVRVEMDTTAPYAELRMPAPASGQRDCLVMSWKAEDRNLLDNPISLEWSANANGPWNFIGDARLPNTGNYHWKISETVPPAVYLKLTVRDKAGNVAVAQTDKAVIIDLDPPDDVTGVTVEK